MNSGSLVIAIKKFCDQQITDKTDDIAVEEPLEIRLRYEDAEGKEINQTISVTMRTPGHDFDLALGFLYTEGVIEDLKDVVDISLCGPVLNLAKSQNIIRVKLAKNININLTALNRYNFSNSSCGICGKTSIESLRIKLPDALVAKTQQVGPFCDPMLILKLPDLLKSSQAIFKQTGGLHASALFSTRGELISVREDVGRHNALDKIIGHAFRRQNLPLDQAILLVSGRVSFELVQKASMAGIAIIAAVGAPSSLALELAQERGISLVGFIRDQQFNIYCGAWRISDEATCRR